MEVRFHPEALTELVGAMDWYGDRSDRASRTFVIEFERAVLRMHEAPLRWPGRRPVIEGWRRGR